MADTPSIERPLSDDGAESAAHPENTSATTSPAQSADTAQGDEVATPPSNAAPPTQAHPGTYSDEALGWVSTGASVAGLTVLPLVGSVAGLILGYISKRQAVREGHPTPPGAVAGIVLGWVGVAVSAVAAAVLAVLLILVVFIGAASINTPGQTPPEPNTGQQWQSQPQDPTPPQTPLPPQLGEPELQEDLQRLLDLLSEDITPQSTQLEELLGLLDKYQAPTA